MSIDDRAFRKMERRWLDPDIKVFSAYIPYRKKQSEVEEHEREPEGRMVGRTQAEHRR